MKSAPDNDRPTRTPRPRPGGRTARIRTQVLEAVHAELTEHGYDALTIDTVAARAGVHRATVYRRWRGGGGFLAAGLAAPAALDGAPPAPPGQPGGRAAQHPGVPASVSP
ncbi:helix-turn-helix domain-containing protein, partial [Nocardia cyriacigeorgica]|uniref:helix-turn-helix domain-containing protein n=1 Tax=Nocardia cyriacigeorgica TaxID=135487 RepID=UPI002457A1C7